MHYSKLTERSKLGTNAVMALRKSRLSSGHPFMINTPTKSYLEYANGKIYLVKRDAAGLDFTVIRELTELEATELRHIAGII